MEISAAIYFVFNYSHFTIDEQAVFEHKKKKKFSGRQFFFIKPIFHETRNYI